MQTTAIDAGREYGTVAAGKPRTSMPRSRGGWFRSCSFAMSFRIWTGSTSASRSFR